MSQKIYSKLFTVTSHEWDGGSELHYVDRQVEADNTKEARRRFNAFMRKNSQIGKPKITSVRETSVIR